MNRDAEHRSQSIIGWRKTIQDRNGTPKAIAVIEKLLPLWREWFPEDDPTNDTDEARITQMRIILSLADWSSDGRDL